MKPDKNLIIDSINTENEEVNGFLPEFSHEVDEFYENHSLLLYEEPIQNKNSFIKFLSNGSSAVESDVNELCSFQKKVDEVYHENHYTNGISSVDSKTDDTEFCQNKILKSSHRGYSKASVDVESSFISSKKCSNDKNSKEKKNGSFKEPVIVSKRKKKILRDCNSTKSKESQKMKLPEIPDNFQMPSLHAHFKNSVNTSDLTTANDWMDNIPCSSKTLTEAEKMIIASKKSKLKKGAKAVKNSKTNGPSRDVSSKRKKSFRRSLSITSDINSVESETSKDYTEAKAVKNSKTNVPSRDIISKRKKSVRSLSITSDINSVESETSKDKDKAFYLSDEDKAINQAKNLRIPLTDILKYSLDFKRKVQEICDLPLVNELVNNTPHADRKLESSGAVANKSQKNAKDKKGKKPLKASTMEKFPKIKMTARKSFKQNNLNSSSFFSSKKQINSSSVNLLEDSCTSEHEFCYSTNEKALADTKTVIRKSPRVMLNKRAAAVSSMVGKSSKNNKLGDKIVSTDKKVANKNNVKDAIELTDSSFNNTSGKEDMCIVDDFADVEIKSELEIEQSLPSSDSSEVNDSLIIPLSDNFNTGVNDSKSQQNSNILQLLNKVTANEVNSTPSTYQTEFIDEMFNQCSSLNFSSKDVNKSSCNEESDQLMDNVNLKNINSIHVDNDQSVEENFIVIKEVKSLAKDVADVTNLNLNSGSFPLENIETVKAISPEKNSSVYKRESQQQRHSVEKSCQESPKTRSRRSLEYDSSSSLIDVKNTSDDSFSELTKVKKSNFNKVLAKSVQNFRNRKKNQQKSECLTPVSECKVPALQIKSGPELEGQTEFDSDHYCYNKDIEKFRSLTKDVADAINNNPNLGSPLFGDTADSKSQSAVKEDSVNKKESRQQKNSFENNCQELPKKRKGRKSSKADSLSKVKPQSINKENSANEREHQQHSVEKSYQNSPKRRGRKPSKPDPFPSLMDVQSKSDDGSIVIRNAKTMDFSGVLPKDNQNSKNRKKNQKKAKRSIPVECEVPTMQIKSEPGLEEQTGSNSDYIIHNNKIRKRRHSSINSFSALGNECANDYSLQIDRTTVNKIAKSPGRRRGRPRSVSQKSDYDDEKTEKLLDRKKRKTSTSDTLFDCNRDLILSDKITTVNHHIPKTRGRKKRGSCSVDLNSEYSEGSPIVKRKIKTPVKLKDSAEYHFKTHEKHMRRKRSSTEESELRSDEEREPSVPSENNFNSSASQSIVKINPQQNVFQSNSNVFYEMYPVNPQCKILFNPANNMHVIAAPLMTQFNQPALNQQLVPNNLSSVNSSLIASNNQFINNNHLVQSQMPQFTYMQNAPSNLSILPFMASPQNVPFGVPQITMSQHAPSIVTSQNPSTMIPSFNGQAQQHSEVSDPSSLVQTPNPLPNRLLKDMYSAGRKRKVKKSNPESRLTGSSVQMKENDLGDKNSFVTSTPVPNYTTKVYNFNHSRQFHTKSFVSPTPNFGNQTSQALQFNNVQQPTPNYSGISLPVYQDAQMLQLNSVKQQRCDGIDWQTVLTKTVCNFTSNLPVVVNGNYRNCTVRDFFSNPLVVKKLTEEVSKYSAFEPDSVDFSKLKFEFKESYLDEPLVQVLKEFVFTHLCPLYPYLEGKHGQELSRSLFIEAYKKYSLMVCGLLSNLLQQSDMNKFNVNNLTSVFTIIGILIIFFKYKDCMKNSKQ